MPKSARFVPADPWKATRAGCQHVLAWLGSKDWRCHLANLSIRKLDDETYERLKDRAAQRGVSMEEEARQILRRAVLPPERIGDLFLKVFGPARGADLELPRREPHDPLRLE